MVHFSTIWFWYFCWGIFELYLRDIAFLEFPLSNLSFILELKFNKFVLGFVADLIFFYFFYFFYFKNMFFNSKNLISVTIFC